jgi:hypothetical protein
MRTHPTKKDYEDWLNDLEAPDNDLKSNGGLIPDGAKYGTWMKHHDPIAFNVGFNEYEREVR